MSNLIPLRRRVVRDTEVSVEGVPLIVSLEPGGRLGLKKKGERHTMWMPVLDLWRLLAADTKDLPAVTVKAKPKPVKAHPMPVPSALEAALQLIKQSDKPVHEKTLQALVSPQISSKNLKEFIKVCVGEHILERVQPFHIRAVKDHRTFSSV